MQRKGEAATPATEQGVAAEPKKERRRGKECAWIRPFRFCEWGMAARPIGGHKNLSNGKMAATEPFRQFCDRKSHNGSMASRARGRGFGPCLAKFIVKLTHSAQNLVQPFLSPVTFSEVLAGLKISCGRGFGPRLAKFVVTWVKWTHFGQNLARPFLFPVTFNEVLAGHSVTFSEVFSYLGGLGGSREPCGQPGRL